MLNIRIERCSTKSLSHVWFTGKVLDWKDVDYIAMKLKV